MNSNVTATVEVHGPVRITANRQISLPKALLDEVRMGPGDRVHLVRDVDGTVRVVDSRTIGQWVDRGRRVSYGGQDA